MDARDGNAATSHGLTRDAQGNFWFDINPGRRGLGKLDPKAGKITVYQTPADMTPVGGAVTIDVDGQGKIWASTPEGAVRFDPVTEKFTAYRSVTSKSPKGTVGDLRRGGRPRRQRLVGADGDRHDRHANVKTGEVSEIKLAPIKAEMERFAADRAFYESFGDAGFSVPIPWSPGPRRMGTDKNADVLWVGNSWGASLTRINTRTKETTIIPLPNPALQAYHIHVDSRTTRGGTSGRPIRSSGTSPAANRFTMFDIPVHGTEARHISLLEQNGQLHVVIPVYRTNQMGVMTVRSEADLQALRAQR